MRETESSFFATLSHHILPEKLKQKSYIHASPDAYAKSYTIIYLYVNFGRFGLQIRPNVRPNSYSFLV